MPNENTGVENFDSLMNEMESIINEKPTSTESPTETQPPLTNDGEQKQENPTNTTSENQQESGSSGIPEIEIEADDEQEYYERRQKYNQMKPEDQKKSFFEMADSIVEESEEKNLMKDEEDLSIEKKYDGSIEKEFDQVQEPTNLGQFNSPSDALNQLSTSMNISMNSIQDMKKMFDDIENGLEKPESLSTKINDELINIESTIGNLSRSYKFLKNHLSKNTGN
mgnify:CR=1 FL=1